MVLSCHSHNSANMAQVKRMTTRRPARNTFRLAPVSLLVAAEKRLPAARPGSKNQGRRWVAKIPRYLVPANPIDLPLLENLSQILAGSTPELVLRLRLQTPHAVPDIEAR